MARLRKIGKYYYLYFRDRSRDPTEKSWPLRVTEQRAARRKASELENAYEEGHFDPWQGGYLQEHVTTEESVRRFLDAKEPTVSNRTLDTYQQQLKALLGTLPDNGGSNLDNLLTEDLRLYVLAYTEDGDGRPSNATQRKRYRHVRAWLNWCVEEGYIDRSPLDDMTQPKEEKKEAAFLKPKDVDRLLIAIEHHMETTMDAVGRTPDLAWLADVIRVAVATGLRRGELVALRWQDVDLEDRRLHVRHRRDFTTKNSRERRVPLRGGALEVLRRMDAEREDDLDSPVFTDRRGLPIKPDRMTKAFKRMVRKAGLDERIHFHSLRHTTGSWLAMKGVPMRVIQSILGHSSISVTERYSHLAPETLDAAMEETFGSGA